MKTLKQVSKTDAQRLESFMKKHRLAYEDIRKIATEYANSPEDKARTHFTEKYKITDHVFYKVLEFAIVCNIVDDDTRLLIRNKSVSNYKLHNEKEKSKKAVDHYADLTRRRKVHFDLIPQQDILDISYKYADGVKLSVISNAYGYSEETIKRLIAKGIIQVITPSSVVLSIRNRVKNEGRSLESFERLEDKRRHVRIMALKPFENEIKMIQFHLDHYEEYFSGDECAPTKEFLEKRLEVVNKKYEYWLDF